MKFYHQHSARVRDLCLPQIRKELEEAGEKILTYKIMLLTILLMAFLNPAKAESQTRASKYCMDNVKLYRSYSEYSEGKFIDSICLSGKKHKFSVYYNKLTLKHGQQKQKYPHGSLWGYERGKDVFRYFNKGTTFGTYGYHKIIVSSGLIIYSKYERGGYRYASRTYYFYSKDINAPLERLSVKNLEKDFSNPWFIKEVKALKSLTESDNDGNLLISAIYNKYYQ
ncbi:hypothetical protein ACR78Z_04035 [Sphingobacterium thalpophilum]|uniref:Uncharacterized protein n=3 Tax=Bacteroidota TaxID=976 RepID=A0A4U9VKA9_9SPHI|nr:MULTISPECIES: hypothetical protein [Bacteroidota]OJV50352.1 MAG: hypothetical protein BGO31_13335 [Bacteroidetes bacterium 43-16]AZA84117.1 hypothetical protein EG342_20485 [Chryseobacterium lactis]AZB04503.1 hypothetical protein EG341_11360 [Chryseobacterium lactis]MCT3745484.1 hypothetical protein [Elizabethkingia anophelis]MDC8026231.1 hypothetical protein [Elizabethkingia anophelis]